MGEFAVAGAVLLVVVAVLVVIGTVRRPAVGPGSASEGWRLCTEARRRGVTTVLLRRGSHVIVVREIQDDSPTWQDDLIAARAEGAERLATLEAGL